MFSDITGSYDGSDATWEILLMLLGAFILGYLVRLFVGKSKYGKYETQIAGLESNLNSANTEKMQFASELDDYKARFSSKIAKPEDLKVVEGIGPKIESLLKAGGINNWSELANAEINRLKGILSDAGDRYRIHDPSTWPKQANMADNNKWEELEAFQNSLTAGRTK
ncbi:MAG: hypothetical protein ACR2MX_03565 [Cyclobacteriaceae bacterium]